MSDVEQNYRPEQGDRVERPVVSTLPATATLDEVCAFFEHDRFPTTSCHPEVLEAAPGHALVRMAITPSHLNALGNLMGGVSFTLADFAFAIAANLGRPPTVSASSTIDFLGVARGHELTATCDVDRDGRSMCFATVHVADELGTQVARVSFVGHRRTSR